MLFFTRQLQRDQPPPSRNISSEQPPPGPRPTPPPLPLGSPPLTEPGLKDVITSGGLLNR